MFTIYREVNFSAPTMFPKLIRVLKYDYEVYPLNECKPMGIYAAIFNSNMFSKTLIICNAHNKVNNIHTDGHIFDIIQDGMHPANTLYILKSPTYLRNPSSVCKSVLVLITSVNPDR